MKIIDEKKELLAFILIAGLAIFIFSFYLFGMTGVRVVLGILMGSLPFYIFLNATNLEESEKIVFALLLGLTLFPSLVFLLGFLVSFRMSIFVIFILLAIAAFLFSKFKK